MKTSNSNHNWRQSEWGFFFNHRPVLITLNSCIWNIKTMKHNSGTKTDSYKCGIIRPFKKNRLHWKTTVFFPSLKGDADTQNRQWNVNMIMPFTRSEFYLTADERKKRNGWGKAEKNRTAIFVWRQFGQPRGSGCGPGFKGLSVIGQNE